MGNEAIQIEPAFKQDSLDDSYSIISFPGMTLPERYSGIIYARWLRSLRYLNDYFKLIEQESYFSNYKKYIQSILARPTTFVRLAVLSSDYDVVLGWCIVDRSACHYIHVQMDFRKKGIGRSLFPQSIDTITHLTKIGLSIWGSKLKNVVFNPFY